MCGRKLMFCEEYGKKDFVWVKSNLFSFLCDCYGFNDVVITLKNGDEKLLKRYNVVGMVDGEEYINIYETNGVDNVLFKLNLFDIDFVSVSL